MPSIFAINRSRCQQRAAALQIRDKLRTKNEGVKFTSSSYAFADSGALLVVATARQHLRQCDCPLWRVGYIGCNRKSRSRNCEVGVLSVLRNDDANQCK